MSSKKTVAKHKSLNVWYNKETGLVFNEDKKFVVGRIVNEEVIDLDDESIDLAEKNGYKVDPTLFEDEDVVEEETSAPPTESAEKVEKVEKKTETVEKTEKVEKKVELPVEKVEKTEKTEKTEKVEKVELPVEKVNGELSKIFTEITGVVNRYKTECETLRTKLRVCEEKLEAFKKLLSN